MSSCFMEWGEFAKDAGLREQVLVMPFIQRDRFGAGFLRAEAFRNHHCRIQNHPRIVDSSYRIGLENKS